MLALKYLLTLLAGGLFASAAGIVMYDIFTARQLRLLLARTRTGESGAAEGVFIAPRPIGPVRWRLAQQLAAAGVLPLFFALSINVVLDGR